MKVIQILADFIIIHRHIYWKLILHLEIPLEPRSRSKRSDEVNNENEIMDDNNAEEKDDPIIQMLSGETKCKARFWKCLAQVAQSSLHYMNEPGGVSGWVLFLTTSIGPRCYIAIIIYFFCILVLFRKWCSVWRFMEELATFGKLSWLFLRYVTTFSYPNFLWCTNFF